LFEQGDGAVDGDRLGERAVVDDDGAADRRVEGVDAGQDGVERVAAGPVVVRRARPVRVGPDRGAGPGLVDVHHRRGGDVHGDRGGRTRRPGEVGDRDDDLAGAGVVVVVGQRDGGRVVDRTARGAGDGPVAVV